MLYVRGLPFNTQLLAGTHCVIVSASSARCKQLSSVGVECVCVWGGGGGEGGEGGEWVK